MQCTFNALSSIHILYMHNMVVCNICVITECIVSMALIISIIWGIFISCCMNENNFGYIFINFYIIPNISSTIELFSFSISHFQNSYFQTSIQKISTIPLVIQCSIVELIYLKNTNLACIWQENFEVILSIPQNMVPYTLSKTVYTLNFQSGEFPEHACSKFVMLVYAFGLWQIL